MNRKIEKTKIVLRYRLIGTQEIHTQEMTGAHIPKRDYLEFANGDTLHLSACDWHEFETVRA